MALIDFTLSNARRFYSSMENPLGVKGLRGTCKIRNDCTVFLTLSSSSGRNSSTKLLGNTPTLPFSSPSHQPSLSAISLLIMVITSPTSSCSSSGFSGSYAKVTLARSFAFFTENIHEIQHLCVFTGMYKIQCSLKNHTSRINKENSYPIVGRSLFSNLPTFKSAVY